ncbi:secretion protein EspA [Trinickia sp.]|jgi:secreted effector protein SseB|uniref:secretion protein EspA n=1 Tax=Trinickia sp. TaxID=2571163 RepID=UPI002D7FC06D|nr:secretion protein EspA [Trinickia sp.]
MSTVMTPFLMNHNHHVGRDSGVSTTTNGVPFDQNGLDALRNSDSPFGKGVLTMSDMMALLNVLANKRMDDIENKMKVSENAQNMANRMENVIAKISDPTKDHEEVPQDVIDYMAKNGILVDGKSVNDFISASKESDGKLNKANLMDIKSALESQSTEASNFVQTSTLKIQQIMQTYNIAAQMTNSLQSMGAEMNKSIASSIR